MINRTRVHVLIGNSIWAVESYFKIPVQQGVRQQPRPGPGGPRPRISHHRGPSVRVWGAGGESGVAVFSIFWSSVNCVSNIINDNLFIWYNCYYTYTVMVTPPGGTAFSTGLGSQPEMLRARARSTPAGHSSRRRALLRRRSAIRAAGHRASIGCHGTMAAGNRPRYWYPILHGRERS
eukprot:SAG31_NODE_8686_length_1406_cov_1.080337_1_plen_178_part_00